MDIKEMSVDELMERRSAIATEVDSEGADFDALESEVRSINAELEARKDAETKKAEVRSAVAEGLGEIKETIPTEERKTMDINEIRNSDAYIEAFARYTKTGDDAEVRSLLTDNANGTIPVPTFVGEIVAKRLEASKILSRVRRMNAAGNVKVGFEISAPAAVAHEEGGEALTEEALALGIVELIPKTWKKYVQISDEALDSMNGRAYLEYIYDEVARGIIKARENAVISAILNAPQTADASHPSVAKTGTAPFNIADFVNARALLSSAAEDLVIIVTPSQYASYKALQLGASYGADPFDGIEVLFNDTVTSPIIGDLAGVMENCPKGDSVEFKYDDKTKMTEDLVLVLGRLPSAIEVVGDKFFAKVSA